MDDVAAYDERTGVVRPRASGRDVWASSVDDDVAGGVVINTTNRLCFKIE